MKLQTIILCALFSLAVQIVAHGDKTEIVVQKGTVRAEMGSDSVDIAPGRKAILTPGENLAVTVDDPMVDDVMAIYKWAEQEKQARKIVIDSVSIQSIKIENENNLTLAYLWETPNTGSKSSDTCYLGYASILDNPKYYDLQGNLLDYDLEKINDQAGNYSIRFPDLVKPGEKFRYICVSKIKGPISKGGMLRYLSLNWSSPNQLNYFRFILPPSAIFVDATRPVVTSDSFEGCPAVILRNYTGAISDGQATVGFLWPELDGTTLADLPDKYRGLRDSSEEAIVQAGRLEMAQILAGKVYTKQSTPLETLLSVISSIIHSDKETLLNLMASPRLREIASEQYDEFFSKPLVKSMIMGFDFLGTPDWPSDPPNDYTHPVYLSRKGSQIRAATCMMQYRDGKWYHNGMNIFVSGAVDPSNEYFRNVNLSQDTPNLEAVSYNGLVKGEFMKRWLFLEPIHIPWNGPGHYPDGATQTEWFNQDPLPLDTFHPTFTVNGKIHKWMVLEARNGIFDLNSIFDAWHVTGYAWAQIEMPQETRGILGIGSDDHVKVFLNGKLIHENLINRGVTPDDDRVPVTFKKGKNQLVLKIQNGDMGWGFACRLLEVE